MQVGGQAVDDLGPQPSSLLPAEDVAADLPVQQDEFAVDREGGPDLRRLNPALDRASSSA